MHVALSNITKVYGSQRVLDGVSVTFQPGHITAIVGGNGEGKTTLLNIMTGYVAPDSGRILIGGEEMTGRPPYKIARKGVARLFQELRLFPSMSVLENVMVGFGEQTGENPLLGLLSPKIVKSEKARCIREARTLLQLVGLEEHEGKSPAMLSYGESKLLAFAVLLGAKPPVLLLDEPLAGLSPENVAKLASILQAIKTGDRTIVVVDHNRDFIEDIFDTIMVLKDGRIKDTNSFPGFENVGR
jgi:ABC-type branched-subunit amino acid transport system ATPase component